MRYLLSIFLFSFLFCEWHGYFLAEAYTNASYTDLTNQGIALAFSGKLSSKFPHEITSWRTNNSGNKILVEATLSSIPDRDAIVSIITAHTGQDEATINLTLDSVTVFSGASAVRSYLSSNISDWENTNQ